MYARYRARRKRARRIPMSSKDHEHQARIKFGERPLSVAVITVSDSRTPATDTSGDLIVEYVCQAENVVNIRALVPDDSAEIRMAILAAATQGADAILLTGGTGISRRDGTVDVLRSMSSVELEGFGERFRAISFESIGVSAMLSRACAVIIEFEGGRRIPTFSMPGSTDAVTTATRELIVPILRHVVWDCLR